LLAVLYSANEHAGLFTFAQSSKHVGLYQKSGVQACKLLTNAVYEGLDVSHEILAVCAGDSIEAARVSNDNPGPT
jgi:hypothetical protein